MAEESINTPVASETIEPDGGNLRSSFMGKPSSPSGGPNKLPDYRRASVGSYHCEGNSRRNSMGKPTTPNNGHNILPHHVRASTGSFPNVANLRRNSTGKPSSPNNGESVAPHYLRASTGSCHDFCKYGRNHAFEVKARRPIPKRVITPPSNRLPTEFGIPAERKTTMVVKPKPSPVSRTFSPDSPSIIKKEVSSASEKVEVSSRQASSNEKKIAQNGSKKNFPGKHTPVKPKSMIVKPLSSTDTSGGLNARRNSEIKMAKRTATQKAAVKKILASPGASLSPRPSVNRVVSLNVKKYRSLKLVSPLKDQNRIRKAEPKPPNREKVPEKTLHVIKVETGSEVLESTQNGSTIHYPLFPTLSSPMSSSLLKSPALSFHEEEAQEESEYTDSEVDEADDSISERSETANLLKVETSEGNHKKTPRNAGVGLSDDKDCAPAKLKFKRGKVIDLQSDNSGPRRLRFRRGRGLGENQDGKAEGRKRSFKKRGVEVDKNGTDPGSEKVVLRHQDVQGKKDAQGLFNNVIEETASKLVESRKSKVKALVGAFETVISLQESKPSP